MKNNMGIADRVIRVVIAVVIGVLYFTNIIAGIVGLVLFVLGVIFVLTSIIGFCPLYTIFGLKTCPAKKE